MDSMAGRHELSVDRGIEQLRELATLLIDSPEAEQLYNRTKAELLGHPDPNRRREGDHPWPTRIHGGKEFIYSVPIFAGVSPERGTLLYIGKDNWQDGNEAWLASLVNLRTGRGFDLDIVHVTVEAQNDRRVWMQIAPPDSKNWPPPQRHALSGLPRYDQMAIEGHLDDEYHLYDAVVHEGFGRADVNYQDYGALEWMLMVSQRQRMERESVERLSHAVEIGERAVVASQWIA